MCGICGFVSRQIIKQDTLESMNNTMYHRGPDDSGAEIFDGKEGYQIGMAQRRLAILDLSPLGHQPMHSTDGRISVVYNGEIYNFTELKEELRDYSFLSQCDTEVIIAAYLKWGINCVEKFNGMFAIALFDREQDILYLVRDRIGKKPLYYHYKNENLVFASELKPILKVPEFHEDIRQELMTTFMMHQYINAPNTIFENVYKVEPGEILSFQYGKITKRKYWDLKNIYTQKKKEMITDYREAKEELTHLLREAVRRRMISDVPLGTFLSGGYDSSLITALAQSISEEPVKTYSIGFHEEKFNEAKYAKEVSDYLGTKHTELYVDEEDMFQMVESIAEYYDEPFADSSQIPTMLVSQLARRDVTVTLSGDGGDEFFCGYNLYQDVETARKLDGLGALTYGVCNLPGIKSLHIMDKLPLRVQAIAKNREKESKTQFTGNSYIDVLSKMLKQEQLDSKYLFESKYEEQNWQMRRMLLDMDTYLPGDILCKVDRASMKYSLESRCPILDKEVMEYSFRLPHEFKYQNDNKKRILKDITYEFVPKELLDRPKVGFGVPLDKWMRGPLREQLLAMCSTEFLTKQNIFHVEYTKNFVENYLKTGDKGPGTGENYSKILWSYFVFQQWYQKSVKSNSNAS